jgi:hypothetical protein
VEEGRGDEDVSPYFSGQTNAQALGTHQIVKLIEDPPPVVGAIFALAQRSWFSLATAVASALGATDAVKTALTDAPTDAPTDALQQPASPVVMAAEALRIRQDIER